MITDLLKKGRHFLRHSSLLRKNAAVLPRVASGYARTLLLRRDVLRTVEFTITPECNCNCKMCYASRLRRSRDEYLTVDEYRDLWRQARQLGAFSAILSGGEPTIRRDFFDVVAAIEPEQTLIALVTNATMLDHAMLHRLQDAHINVIHLSLNSTDPEVNDRERDFAGHHQRVLEMGRAALEMGFEICLSTVVCHGELERTAEVVALGARYGFGVVFSLACPTGNWAGSTDKLLTPEDWVVVQQMMQDNPHVRSDWTINFSLRTECPGGREKICISPYGDVMGCGMNFVSLGNVREESLVDIWRRSCAWPPFRQRSPRCLIALDEDYLREYLLPVSGYDELPVRVEDHPVHPLRRSRP